VLRQGGVAAASTAGTESTLGELRLLKQQRRGENGACLLVCGVTLWQHCLARSAAVLLRLPNEPVIGSERGGVTYAT
jgi:hypothetical protein